MAPDESDPRLLALGRALRQARRERDLSQEEVARRAGVHPNHVGRIERGSQDIRVTTLLRLLSALEVSPSAIGLPELGSDSVGPVKRSRSRVRAGREQDDDLLRRIDGARSLLLELRTAVERGAVR